MNTIRWRHLLALLLGLALLGAACGDDEEEDTSTGGTSEATASESEPDEGSESESEEGSESAAPSGGGGSITVGSADFSDSSLVASMYAQVLEQGGYDVEEQLNVGSREVYFEALQGGEIDVVPEFVSTLAVFLDGEGDSDLDTAVTNLEEVLPEGIIALEPSEADSTNVFVTTQEKSDELGLTSMSDLTEDIVLGGPPECPERPFCILGINETYGVDLEPNFVPLDAGGPLSRSALDDGSADVVLLFSTDGSIIENDYVVLEDDENLQQADNVVAVVREETVDDAAQELINEVSSTLTVDDYNELNKRVNIDQEDVEDVAREYLVEQGLLEE